MCACVRPCVRARGNSAVRVLVACRVQLAVGRPGSERAVQVVHGLAGTAGLSSAEQC